MKLFTLTFLLVAVGMILPGYSGDQAATVRKSLIRVTTTSQTPDYIAPWNPGKTSGGRGAGFVIAGNRIMTNAHVISDARLLTVEKEGDPNKYIAQVAYVAHDCDLALLTVEDAAFFENTLPLEFGGIPGIESTVSAYGYPIGGDRMSVTRGIVSRADFQPYSHSSADTHLTIQIDAAINPGNSGGPVLQESKVVGVAFQGYSGAVAQNTGYMIPTPVVKRFLKDVEDGKYDHYVDLSITYSKLLNPAQRKALGVSEENRGVMVGSVFREGSCDGVLQTGDVILALDDIPVASDGYVEIDGQRIEMAEVVERKFLGDEVKLTILREQKKQDVTATLKRGWPYLMQARAYEVAPEYVLFGGLLFQPLTRDFLSARRIKDKRIQYFYERYITDEIYLDHPQLIILSDILADPVNTYLSPFENTIVDEVNDKKIRTLADLAAAFEKTTEYYVIRVLGEGRPLVLEAAAVHQANPRIMQRYKVPEARRIHTAGGEQ